MRQYIYTYKYEYIFLCANLYCSKLNNFPSGMLDDEGCFKWRSLCPGIYNIQTPVVVVGVEVVVVIVEVGTDMVLQRLLGDGLVVYK